MRRGVRPAGAAVLVAVALGVLPACSASGDGASGMVRVVAGFYPLAEAASRVGGDRVAVTNLTPAGAEPHDLEPRSGDLDRIEAADVVLYLGRGFQPAIEKVVERGDGQAIDLLDPSAGLGPLDGDDPHVWLDPSLMARIAERVRAALAEADPAGAAAYESNAATYSAELLALDDTFRQGLATCERRTIVTSHDAFGYLARRYDLTQDAITGLSPESEPEPNRLSQLASKVRSEGVTTIFYEELVSPRVAETLARETGARTAVLDPIEGLSDEDRKDGRTYASQMRANLDALRAALGCR